MSTDTTPQISLLTRIINKLIENGQLTVALLILSVISFIFFNWIQENNRQEIEDKKAMIRRMEHWEKKYDALDTYVRREFTPAIEKNNRVLEEVSKKLDKND